MAKSGLIRSGARDTGKGLLGIVGGTAKLAGGILSNTGKAIAYPFMHKDKANETYETKTNYSDKDMKSMDGIAKKVADAESENAEYVILRSSDVKHLIELGPKKEGNHLKQHLEAQKGQTYVNMPRKVLETALESMPYAQSERFFVRRLEGMMQHAAREYVTLPSADLKKLIALEPKKRRIQLEHLLKEQEGQNIRVLTLYVKAAIDAYYRDKVPHRHEEGMYKAAAVVLLLASLPLMFPPSVTGYAFYPVGGAIGYGFFNILLGFVAMAVALYVMLRE